MTALFQTTMTVGDIGTTLVMVVIDPSTDAARDISGATTKDIVLRAPDQTTKTWAASFTTDGTDGSLTYTTVDGDVDQAGTWVYEAHIEGPGTEDFRSPTQFQFRVKGALS